MVTVIKRVFTTVPEHIIVRATLDIVQLDHPAILLTIVPTATVGAVKSAFLMDLDPHIAPAMRDINHLVRLVP